MSQNKISNYVVSELFECVSLLLCALLGSQPVAPVAVPATLSLTVHVAASRTQHPHAETSDLQKQAAKAEVLIHDPADIIGQASCCRLYIQATCLENIVCIF